MSTSEASSIDTEILARVVNAEVGDLPPDLAALVLKFDFQPSDRETMRVLAEKACEGELSEPEQELLDGFIRVGNFLGLLKSKARASLKKRTNA